MDFSYDDVPRALKAVDQWILWSNDNGTKIPRCADGKGNARTNDSSTFSTFDKCVERLRADMVGEYSGIAFVITREDNFVGIDLDACLDIDDDGNPSPKSWAIPIIGKMRGVSYGERSPSGNGVKFLTYGKKVPGSRCVKQFAGAKEQIEVYDHSRFWCITGECCGPNHATLGDGSAQVAALCDEYLAAEQAAPTLAARATPVTRVSSDSDMLYRAERYIATAGGVQEGGRNNAAFAISGHLRSLRDHDGRGMSDGDILSMMRRWNATLPSPLPDNELAKATESSRSNGTPRAEKLADEEILPSRSGDYSRLSDDTDISQFLRTVKAGTNDENPIPPECLNVGGTIGEIMAYNRRTAMFWQPELALAGAISVMSLMLGKRFCDHRGTRANIYLVSLAPSGSGKEHARKVNKQIIGSVFEAEEVPHLRCPDGIASDVALLRLAADGERLLQIDEAAKFMSVTKSISSPWLRKIPSVLLKLFTSSDSSIGTDELADRERSKVILHPFVSVYATSTTTGWWDSLDEATLTDGLLARLVIVESSDAYPDANEHAVREEPPADLVERLRAWAMHGQLEGDLVDEMGDDPSQQNYDVTTVNYAPDALARYNTYQADVRQHMRDLDTNKNRSSESKQGIWSRAGEKAAKLALISACSNSSPGDDVVVRLEDVEFAIALTEATSRRLVAESAVRVNSGSHEKAVNDIARIITSRRGDGISKPELVKETSSIGRRQRQEALADLLESRRVEYDSDCDRYYAIARIS